MDQPKRAVLIMEEDAMVPAHSKPLMLEDVMFCPILTWMGGRLRADGVQRFFIVCGPRFAKEAEACFPEEADVTVSERQEDLADFLNTPDTVSVLLRPALPMEEAGPGFAYAASGYELQEAYFTYQGNGWNVLILYPQLSGQPGDEALSERIRQLALGTDPEVFMGPFDYSEWPNGGTEDGDWQAMRYDDRLFSVLLRNEGYVKGAAHPSSRLLTLTGDRQTGEVLSLEDVVDVGEDLEDWLYAQDWTPLNHRNNSKEELVARCLTDYAARSSHTTDFYLTEEELVLVSWFFPDPTLLSAPLEALSGLREGFL